MFAPHAFMPRAASATGVTLRISVTDRCQYRCIYCRPTDNAGKTGHMAIGDLASWLGCIAAAVPISKVRITGGEPCMHTNLDAVVSTVRSTCPGAHIGLTTNGELLADQIQTLIGAGLDSVNISLDAIDPHTFQRRSGGGSLPKVLAGIEAATAAGTPVKLNTVLQSDLSDNELIALVRFARHLGSEIRFIELMPIGPAASWFSDQARQMTDVRALLDRVFGAPQSSPRSDTAHRWRYNIDGGQQTVGVIPSYSAPFCSTCNRLRLDRHGLIWPCLRKGQSFDLAGSLATMDIATAIASIHALSRNQDTPPEGWVDRPMIGIGG